MGTGVDAVRIEVPYSPREHQLRVHRERKRFSVLVAHRRFGKTVMTINELIAQSFAVDKPNPRYAYIAPLYRQAKAVAWDYLKEFTRPIPGVKVNEAELRVDFADRRIQLFGADSPDTLRGQYFDGVVLDEFAQMSPRLWTEVVRPALSDRKGWAIFIGTPMGHNQFYDLYQYGLKHPDWYAEIFRASATGVLDADELESAKATMGEDEYAQEYECSFTAAVRGAYYGKLMEQCASQITAVKWEPNHPVNTYWDLGVADSTVIWFIQHINGEHRVIDYYDASGEGLQHYAGVLSSKPYSYGKHYAPHDIAVKELGSGMSRIETAANFGIHFQVAPNQPVQDGIQAVRTVLPKCWFDAEKCAQGVEALRQYRREWDDVRKVFRSRPLHDWTSHAADAFRYFAVSYRDQKPVTLKPPRELGSWMAA